MLTCEPRGLGADGTLSLRFDLPHPLELGIRGPDGAWFFLVYRDGASLSGLRPLMDKVAFTKRGRYDVVLTDNLESDAADVRIARCVVDYRP